MGLMIEAFIYAMMMIAGGFIWGQQFEANKLRRSMKPAQRKMKTHKW